jgi:hypothetical protein
MEVVVAELRCLLLPSYQCSFWQPSSHVERGQKGQLGQLICANNDASLIPKKDMVFLI